MKKITAHVVDGELHFSDWVQIPNDLKIGNTIQLVNERLDNEIARYVRYITTNNYGFYESPSKKPKTLIKLEQLLYIKYGKKIEVIINGSN